MQVSIGEVNNAFICHNIGVSELDFYLSQSRPFA